MSSNNGSATCNEQAAAIPTYNSTTASKKEQRNIHQRSSTWTEKGSTIQYGLDSRPPTRNACNNPQNKSKTYTSGSTSVPNLGKTQEDPAGSSGPTIPQSSLSSSQTFRAINENTVYIAVHTRPLNQFYRCGVFIPVFKEGEIGAGWYAKNAQGDPEITWCAMHQVILDKSLILLFEAGKLVHDGDMSWVNGLRRLSSLEKTSAANGDNDTVPTLTGVDRNAIIPAGESQLRVATAEQWDCTTSVQKAMSYLLDENLIGRGPTPVSELVEKACKIAGQLKNRVTSGHEPVVV